MTSKKLKEKQHQEQSLLPNSAILFKLQEPKNNGRGVSCVRDIYTYLVLGDMGKAKAVVNNEWDKISSYPDIAQWLKDHELADKNNYVTS